MRLLAPLIAVACVAVMIAIGVLAQLAPHVFFEPASGSNVRYYEARIRTLDGGDVRHTSLDAVPLVELRELPPEPYWIDVRAWGSGIESGDWGEHIPQSPDCDGNGGIGISDLWCMDGIGEFTKFITHYGHSTVFDDRLGLRRCKE